MTAKERLRSLIEDLSEEEAATALVIVEQRRSDPLLRALAEAPSDDEPSSPEEDASARDAVDAYRKDDLVSSDDLKRELEID